jgi:hypothetical protein
MIEIYKIVYVRNDLSSGHPLIYTPWQGTALLFYVDLYLLLYNIYLLSIMFICCFNHVNFGGLHVFSTFLKSPF